MVLRGTDDEQFSVLIFEDVIGGPQVAPHTIEVIPQHWGAVVPQPREVPSPSRRDRSDILP